MGDFNRRSFLWTGAGLALPPAARRPGAEHVYVFATEEFDVRMTVEFHDRYVSQGFWFKKDVSRRDYCLSAKGEEDRGCLANFVGSLAVARYKIRPRVKVASTPASLRELVRTIDQDARIQARPPFERIVEIQQGVASDIQAFGYEETPSALNSRGVPEPHGPWCLLRQDLYLNDPATPFLVVHWKHALRAIRILDLIPGDGTRMIAGQTVENGGSG